MASDDKVFYAGLAVALGYLARRGEDTLVEDCMKSNGVTIDDLRKAKVDGFDLRPIGKVFRKNGR